MIQKLQDPESLKQVTTAEEYTRTATRMARLAAGLTEYAMDDPERPFTEEYDPPKNQGTEASETAETAHVPEQTEPEDTTPSADNRAMYKPITAGERRAIPLHQARLALQAAQEKYKDVRI